MASLQSNLLLLLLAAAAAAAADETTTTSMQFYMHDMMSGSSPSAVRVVQGPNSTGFTFGDVFVVDDPLTEGPAADSALVGRAQGFYAFASQRSDGGAAALLLCLNLVFPNGSTVAVMGHDPIYAPLRELPVVGGTGAFRLALGYVLVRTHTQNTSSGDAVWEWQLHLSANNSAQIDPSSTSTPSGPSSSIATRFPSFHFSLFCILILHFLIK